MDTATIAPPLPESFIPVSRFALIEHLSQLPVCPEKDQAACKPFFRQLAAWRHQQFRERLTGLKKCYLPFSPDRDTVKILQYHPQEKQALLDTLIEQITRLLVKANYQRISADDLNALFTAQSPHGLQLKVDLSEFEQMLLFSRGSQLETRERRTLKSLYLKKESYQIALFQRLFLLLKLKPEKLRIQEIMAAESVNEKKAEKLLHKYRSSLPDRITGDHVYLKLFKRIPQVDLEMLFPNTRVQLKTFDKLKLGITAGGGTVGSITATITKITAAANPFAAAGALAGLAGVIFRQVMKFFSQRTKYMMQLAQNLYFHNLANNRGVLTLMVDRAEEEEIKESMLLYTMLSRHPTTREALPELKQHCEDWLYKTFHVRVDFDIHSPLEALINDGLIEQNTEGKLTPLPPQKASQHLETLWQQYLTRDESPEDEIEDDDSI